MNWVSNIKIQFERYRMLSLKLMVAELIAYITIKLFILISQWLVCIALSDAHEVLFILK